MKVIIFKKLLVPSILFFILTVFSLGCGGGGGDGGNGGDLTPGGDSSPSVTMEGPPPLDFSPVEGGSDSQLISADTGGTLTADAATLEIPAGALSLDTTVSMRLFRDTSRGDHSYLAMFEPDGLLLNTPATLVIALDPPLPLGMNLNLIVVDSSDPAEFYDTGDYVEVTTDRAEVRIPIESFSGAGCAKLNCHGHSLRRMVAALEKRGESKDNIIKKICDTIDCDNYKIPSVKKEDGKEIKKADEIMALHYDMLFREEGCFIEPQELLAYLNTFYDLATLRLNARYSDSIVNGKRFNDCIVDDLDRTDTECIEKLKGLTTWSDLPPILLFGKKFTVNDSPDSVDTLGDDPVIYDSVPHSAPLMVWGEMVKFENGLSLQHGTTADDLEECRDNNPDTVNLIPRVAAVDLDHLDYFRLLISGEQILEEFWKCDPEKEYKTGTCNLWGAVRVWVPKGQNPELCDLVFPRTYKGSGYYVSTVSHDYGENESATCGASSEWTITLNADGTLTAQWDITETVRTTPSMGRAECFSYAEPVTVKRGGTHANGSFEWQESTIGPNQFLKGVYDTGTLKTDPEVWSNSFEINRTGGIQSWTVSMSFSLKKMNE